MVSEIMLQQTTVEAVKPYYHKFISKWPSVKKLADSELEDIMDSLVRFRLLLKSKKFT